MSRPRPTHLTLALVFLLPGAVASAQSGQPAQTGQPAPPTVKREAARPPESAQGPAIYKQYCAACHGVDGKGHGPAAPALKVPPTDLTTFAKRHGGQFSETDLREIIEGDRDIAAHGSKEMPIWGEVFRAVMRDRSFRELRTTNLIRYLESIQVK